jgi:hypothetical protein
VQLALNTISGGPGTLSGTNPQAAVAGVATFSNLDVHAVGVVRGSFRRHELELQRRGRRDALGRLQLGGRAMELSRSSVARAVDVFVRGSV